MTEFKFRFGEQVRVLPPHPHAGATGRIVNGRLYPNGQEIYGGDMTPLDWLPDAEALSELDDSTDEYFAQDLESLESLD